MLVFRYLAKEIFITLISLTAILLLIFMSNQFVVYLNRAASGQIPGMFILKLMMLELPNLIGLLLPLGFYISLLIAYGRLYADSEMTVLRACGYGSRQLLQHSLVMAVMVAGFIFILVMWLGPVIAKSRNQLLQTTGIQTLIKTVLPGQFHAIHGGREVFYVESMNRSHTQAKNIFLARLNNNKGKMEWEILWADKAYTQMDPKTLEDYLILEEGKYYLGMPGQAEYQVATFTNSQAHLPHNKIIFKNDVRMTPTIELWRNSDHDLGRSVELQWRLSIPLMVIVLTLIAVPLSRINPREGKYAKLLPALVIFIIYANLLFIARNWLMLGKIPLWCGMWWLHLLMAGLGFLLIWRNHVKFS